MDVIMRCDDLVFELDTITNQMRYRTRATWWRSRPARNLQRSKGAGSPCHPRTPPKAAQPTAQSPHVTSRYSTRQGGFSPPRGVRFLCAYHAHKARSLSTRLGPACPLGTRRGDGRSLIQANRRSNSRPRFRKHVLRRRLSATPSDHAFRPRLPTCPFGSRTVSHSITTENISQSFLLIIEAFDVRSSKVAKSSGVHATSLCGR